MFTYNENRVLFVENGRLVFPNKVNVRIEFAPNPALGDQLPGLTCLAGSSHRLTWDANTGRSLAESDPPLPRAKAIVALDGIAMRINGRSLRVEFECASRDQLLGILGALHFVAPISLSLEFLDPVIPVITSGRVGNVSFVWQIGQTAISVDNLGHPIRDSRCAGALERLPILCDPRNRRLLAACVYFEKAVRLLFVGAGPSEFAGEAIVNLAKVLEVLFPGPQSRNAVRAGLAEMGYESAIIERKFAPVLLLRSKLDAAHVRMATLQADERRKLQIYLENVTPEFRKLITGVIEAVAAGRLELARYQDDRSPGDEIAKILDGIAGLAVPRLSESGV